MDFEFKLAWRYFRARRKSLTRLTSAVALIGIACGVATLIVAQSLARGFSSEMQDKILGSTAHVTVFQTNGDGISAWTTVKEKLARIENIREVSPTSYESALMVGEQTTSYVVLRAENRKPEAESRNSQASDRIEIAVGAELAERIGVKTGDEAEIILPAGDYGSAPKTSRVRIESVFRTGLYDYDSTWIKISFEDLSRLYEKKDFAPTYLNVSVTDIYAADAVARRIREVLPPDFKVVDWQTANRPLFTALGLERKVSLAIISLMMFVAALNITTTLALLVNERRLDIAVLRTCGAKTRSLVLIFLLEGVFLSLTGIAAGAVIGLTLCFAGNYFRVINLPADVYALSYVPLSPSLSDVLLILAAAFAVSLAATTYPAWRASKIKPLENLKNQ